MLPLCYQWSDVRSLTTIHQGIGILNQCYSYVQVIYLRPNIAIYTLAYPYLIYSLCMVINDTCSGFLNQTSPKMSHS